jgi:septal ring factor EnvC (AmiA/AmiB activator)
MLKNEKTYSTMKDTKLLREIGIGIGIFAVTPFTAFAIYQYVEQRDQIGQLTSDLQKANERIADQGETIQVSEEELKKREAEVEQKEAQLQAKESQLQDQ